MPSEPLGNVHDPVAELGHRLAAEGYVADRPPQANRTGDVRHDPGPLR